MPYRDVVNGSSCVPSRDTSLVLFTQIEAVLIGSFDAVKEDGGSKLQFPILNLSFEKMKAFSPSIEASLPFLSRNKGAKCEQSNQCRVSGPQLTIRTIIIQIDSDILTIN